MKTDHITNYLTMKRLFIFFDEWLSYLLLFVLYSSGYYIIFGIAVVLAIIFNGYGYISYWKVEEKYNDYLINQIKNNQIKDETETSS